MPLVSRRFSEACLDPSLWLELRVLPGTFSTEARWRSFLRWLAARGSGLQTLAFGDRQVWPLTLPSSLWSCFLHCMPTEVLAFEGDCIMRCV